ncbi:retrovirus-related pol polyprotein from transposon TNT 1-94 [Tanacetum coccineum]
MNNEKVIALGMFRIDPRKTSRGDKFVPINKVKASVGINPITISQPHVITKKHVNSDSNGYGDLKWSTYSLSLGFIHWRDLGEQLFSVGTNFSCDSDLGVASEGNLSKDEAPEEIKTFLKKITILLQAPVIIVRTDNGTEFKNQVLQEYFNSVGITHQTSSVRTPQQNGVVERRNRTLVEAARTMLIFSHASLFLWAEAIATTCYTQNRSIIHRRFNKTPYELINGRKPDISFLLVFGALCYPKNDREDIGKLGAKGDIGFFIGYSANSCAYRVYN